MNGKLLSSYVKNKRKLSKITQEELAEKAGVGLRFVRDLEQANATLSMDKVNDASLTTRLRLLQQMSK